MTNVSSATLPELPTPSVSREVIGWWGSIQDDRLPVQRCQMCGRSQYFPRVLCRYCHSDRVEFVEHSGQGTIASYTVLQRGATAAFQALVPYAVALIALDGLPDVKVMSNVRRVDDFEGLRIGAIARVRRVERGAAVIHEFELVGKE